MDSVVSLLPWVTYLRGWCASVGCVLALKCASMVVGGGGMGDVLAWVAAQHVQRGYGGWCVCVKELYPPNFLKKFILGFLMFYINILILFIFVV